MTDKIRLQKFLSEAGVASRRKSEELIQLGRVRVNGRVAELGTKVDPKHDSITVSGKKVLPLKKANYRYIMVNKPRGYITTMNDEEGRKCVASLVENVGARVYPVGRLDRESEGMLLFTNDGAFANAMTHPRNHVPKTYRVTVRPAVTEDMLDSFAVGIVIDGRKTAPADVHVVSEEEGRVVLEMTLYEGRNREIRKMCEALGLEVARLRRIQIGSVKLGMLKLGDNRDLTEEEVHKLKVASGMERPKK